MSDEKDQTSPNAGQPKGFGWLFDVVPEGLILTAEDRILDVNPTLAGWTGSDRNELKGKLLADLLSEAGRIKTLQAKWSELSTDSARGHG